MPTSTDKHPHPPHRPDQHPTDPHGEIRDFENQVSDFDRDYEAPFDANLEPVEDAHVGHPRPKDDINTHGSDR